MSRIILATLLVSLIMNFVLVDCNPIKRPYMPKSFQPRTRRSKGPLQYESAEMNMNLNNANDLIADILKDVDLLMDELQWMESARKNSILSKFSMEDQLNDLVEKI